MIFISYRRSDAAVIAQLIKQSLIDRGFDEKDVFLDLHNITAENFVEKCSAMISKCDSFILLITKDSFKPREGVDYYWKEIHQALDEKKNIIPILYDTTLDTNEIPKEFLDKKLHLLNAIRYDVEFCDSSMAKLVSSLVKNTSPSFLQHLLEWFRIPMLFITIYLCVSSVGGVIRYLWDNYWLSDEACMEIALGHVREDEGQYTYVTRDAIYVYDSVQNAVSIKHNELTPMYGDYTISVNDQDLYKAGFWTMAVGLVHEVGKYRLKPHGNPKTVGVVVAAAVSVIAGFGLGFVVERMLFPVQESEIMLNNVQSEDWWKRFVIEKNKHVSIYRGF